MQLLSSRVAARYIKTGVVKFPPHGCEQLLTQLLGFGEEKRDAAVDALVYLILGLVGDAIEEPELHYVEPGSFGRRRAAVYRFLRSRTTRTR
jgi:hypothetical protein